MADEEAALHLCSPANPGAFALHSCLSNDCCSHSALAAQQRPVEPTRQKHPCVRCGSVSHPRGFRCKELVECECCNSEDHMTQFCWIKHGLQSFNRRVPALVAEQYARWHEQYRNGTYRPLPGGPPRVRVRSRPKPSTPVSAVHAASISDDEADYWYCDAMLGADGGLHVAPWVALVQQQSMAAVKFHVCFIMNTCIHCTPCMRCYAMLSQNWK
mmetsp:Transcript_76471/g.127419  ORF Transcript_76471/g.127419 Transcript_76471/m.127419 type:complete len:214 (+) Transcript_76471:151-792(+)